MKAKILIFVIMLLSFTKVAYCDESFGHHCCAGINITHQFTSDCCIIINVENPLCGDIVLNASTMYVKFTQWNTTTGTYDSISYKPALKGTSVSETLCAMPNETMIKYKIFISDQDGHPYCSIYFEDGLDMYTDSVSVSDCCQCPQSKSEWLKTSVFKSRGCPDGGCLVTLSQLNIPPEDACYTHYQINWGGGTPNTDMKSIATDPIWYNSSCILQGQNKVIHLYLFKDGETDIDSACSILRIVPCTEDVPSIDTTTNACTPDCVNSAWETPSWKDVEVPKGSGCFVKVLYKYRIACPPLNYQDLQVMQITDSHGCGGGNGLTDRQIYQESVIRLVEADPMLFNPRIGDNTCDTLWRIVKMECWRNLYYMTPPDWTHPFGEFTLVLQQCDTGECCVQQYKVCRFAADSVTMEPWGMSMFPANPTCPFVAEENLPYLAVDGTIHWGNTNIDNSTMCHTTCDWVNIIHGGPPVIIEKEAAEQKELNNEPNEKITINCSSEQICNLRIEYFDIQGNLVYTYKKLLQNTVNDLDISSLIEHKGIFVYRVYINDVMNKTGKIIK